MIRVLLALAVLTSSTSAPAHAAGAKVAVLPIVAEGLLPSASDALEQDLRDAVASFGVTVQPSAETRAYLDEGAKTGLDCRLTDEACALRVGLIADVDVVLVTTVELIGERMLLRGAWLRVSGDERRRIAGEIKMPAVDGGRLLRATVGRLVTGKGEASPLPVEISLEPPTATLIVDGAPARAATGGVLWLVPGNHEVRVEAEGHDALDRTVTIAPDGTQGPLAFALPATARAAEAPTLVYVGASMATLGAVLAVSGGVGATFVEADLQAGSVPSERRGESELLGRVSLGGVLVGVLLAAGGTALALVGQSDRPDDQEPAAVALAMVQP